MYHTVILRVWFSGEKEINRKPEKNLFFCTVRKKPKTVMLALLLALGSVESARVYSSKESFQVFLYVALSAGAT